MAVRAALARLKSPAFPLSSASIEFFQVMVAVHSSKQQQVSPCYPPSGVDFLSPRIGGVVAKLVVRRSYHDGQPRGPLWRGKKMIGKEALFVILGLKRFKDDKEKLAKFIKTHVLRLLRMDKIAVLIELERQEEVDVALKIFQTIQKEDWYKPNVYLYKDLIFALAKCKKMEATMQVWGSIRKEKLFPDSQTYAEVIRVFLRYGSPADAMNIYEDMKKSPEPPEELPFRILLKGLLPHPLLRNRVKQDFEELFPERHIYDPPEEIFGTR